ncbi:sigma-70 family RNA polymerase sigma factor [Dyella sp. C11]|uniref:RNA polymerase sigma factor n=1 Tax=Dyella sp. C11 TaxID=2126991 RepID=UPI0018E55AEE|nr:sigma-70 family RNA polymerase sigma factor [Dyella sp. C11]
MRAIRIYALTPLIDAHYKELLGFLRATLRNRHDADDVAQDAYERLLSVGHSGEIVRDNRSLLFRIARNLLADRHRRQAVRRHDNIDEHTDLPAGDAPDDALASQQHAKAMLDTIAQLPPRCREAFILHKFDGLSHAEVATRMGITRNAVEKHVIRALLACRACDDRLHRLD